METARLYSELKQAKDSLEKKNEEMSQLYSQLDRANKDNLKTRKYLEGLVQNIGEAVISYSPEGKILTWNMAAERIFGYSRPEIVGRNMAQLIPDSLIGELEQVAQQVGRGQVIQDMVTTRLRKGGVAFPATITYAPVCGNDDRVLAYSALVRDMTEKQDLQERLVYSQKREALGRLVPPLFHEVSNRLTPVLLESRLIAESAMDPDQAEQAGRLVKAVESIQNLLLPLQTIMYPPSPKLLQAQLNELVQQAVSLVEAKAQQMGATVELNLDPSLPETALDPELMVKALTNLLLNGLQAMALSPMKHLRVATRMSGDNLQVVIQDTGPALDEGRQADLFDLATGDDHRGPWSSHRRRHHSPARRSPQHSQPGRIGECLPAGTPCQVAPPAPPLRFCPGGAEGNPGLGGG